MKGLPHLFNSYWPYSRPTSVKIADGTHSPIVETGTMKLSTDLILKYVLVTSLKCNLISVQKLTSNNHCLAKFVSNSCQFQNLSYEGIIGSARIRDRLYFFQHLHCLASILCFSIFYSNS